MAAAMDCTCWTEDGCMTGADWRLRWELLEATLLSWWPGLVALDLVRTSAAFCWRKKLHNSKMKSSKNLLSHRRCQLMNTVKSEAWMSRVSVIREHFKVLKKQTQNQRRLGKTGQESFNGKVSISRILVFYGSVWMTYPLVDECLYSTLLGGYLFSNFSYHWGIPKTQR